MKKTKKQKKLSKKKLKRTLFKKIHVASDRSFVESLFVEKELTLDDFIEKEKTPSLLDKIEKKKKFERKKNENKKAYKERKRKEKKRLKEKRKQLKKAEKAIKKSKKYLYFKEGITKKELRQFKEIKKEIKKGKGKVKKIPLIFLITIIGTILIFVIFIKNPLIEKYCETGLEKIFEATVEIDSMKVSFLKGGFKFSRIQVTDKDNLNYNLFELGQTSARFNRRALLLKKAVIESFMSKNMLWNTKRKKTGLYLGKEKKSEPGMVKEKANLLKNIILKEESYAREINDLIENPEAFLKSNWNSLKSPVYIEEKTEEYKKFIQKQEVIFNQIRTNNKKIIREGEALTKKNYNKYKNRPEKIPMLIKEYVDYIRLIKKTEEQIEKEIKELVSLEKKLEGEFKELKKINMSDFNHLKSMMPIPDKDIKTLLEQKTKRYLVLLLGKKAETAITLVEFIQDFNEKKKNEVYDPKKVAKKEAKEKEKQKQLSRLKSGRVVPFESFYPDFLIKKATFSSIENGTAWDFILRNLSSEPERWNNPISFNIKIDSKKGNGAGEFLLDVRDEKKYSRKASKGGAIFDGVSFSSTDLQEIGITSIAANAGGDCTIAVKDKKNWLVEANVDFSKIKMQYKKDDKMARIAFNVLNRGIWKFEFKISQKNKKPDFKLKFNLLDNLEQQIGTLLREESKHYIDQVRKEFFSNISNESTDINNFSSDLKNWKKLLKGDMSNLDNLLGDLNKEMLNLKQDNLLNDAKNTGKNILDSVKGLF